MKCETCIYLELVAPNVYCCPMMETELDKDAAIISCEDYKPIGGDEDEDDERKSKNVK